MIMIRQQQFRIQLLSLVALGFVLLFGQSCTDKCEEVYTYTQEEPIYMTYEEIRQPVEALSARALEDPGKIYLKAPYLFINERNEGIHVFDNSNPSSPQNLGFIAIPGNVDLAVKGNILYADNYTDLLAINISNPLAPTLVERVEDAFIQNYWTIDPVLGILVDWETVEYVETYPCGEDPPAVPQNDNLVDWWGPVDFEFNDAGGMPLAGGGSSAGVGGSMARFTLYDDFLYIVTNTDLMVYDVANQSPQFSNTSYVGWEIETIYPFEGNLLIGSTSGMFIYGLEEPQYPQYISMFAHLNACDPVVAEGDYAYVTLRTGNACQGFSDQLDVLDISNIYEPFLVKTYPMTNPHGLGIDDGTLFICDGDDGLKVFDASDVNAIDENMIQHYQDINTYDIIPFNDVAFMIGSDGLFQYDYTDPTNMTLLSTIPVVK